MGADQPSAPNAPRSTQARRSGSAPPGTLAHHTAEHRPYLSAISSLKHEYQAVRILSRSPTIEDTIAAGAGPHGVVVEPTGQRAWVTNLYDDTVSVIDLSTNQTVSTVSVGDKPNGISYSPQSPTPGPATTSVTVPDYATGAEGGHAEH